jgi:hypothetical protein
MAAFVIQNPTGFNEIDGFQHQHDKQFVQILLQPSQTANQSQAATPTTLLRGSVLGMVTSGGAFRLCNNANTDGSQTVAGILEDASVETAQAAPIVATVAISGSFLADRLQWGGSDTVANHFSAITGRITDSGSPQDLYVEPSRTYPVGGWNS